MRDTLPEPMFAVYAIRSSGASATMCVPFWSVGIAFSTTPARTSTTRSARLASTVTSTRRPSLSQTIPCGRRYSPIEMVRGAPVPARSITLSELPATWLP